MSTIYSFQPEIRQSNILFSYCDKNSYVHDVDLPFQVTKEPLHVGDTGSRLPSNISPNLPELFY